MYDRLVVFLLYWITFQDLFLGALYNFIGNKLLLSLLFYLKDILLIALFLVAIFKNKLNKTFSLYIYIYIISRHYGGYRLCK